MFNTMDRTEKWHMVSFFSAHEPTYSVRILDRKRMIPLNILPF